MTTMTYAEVADAYLAAQLLGKLELPVAPTGLKLRRMIREFKALTDDLEEERQKLLKSYAIRDEQGNLQTVQKPDGTSKYVFEPANEKLYNERFNQLVQALVEVKTHPIKSTELAGIKLPAEILFALGQMLEEVEEAETTRGPK